MNIRTFDPSTIHVKNNSTACEACYSRKVKCEPLDDGATCKQCLDHGVLCKPRTRKRKTHPSENGNNGGEETATINPTDPGASRRKHSDVNGFDNTIGHAERTVRRTNSVSVPDLFISRETQHERSPEGLTQLKSPTQTRNASYLSRSAILGDEFPDIDHIHEQRGQLENQQLSSTVRQVLLLHGAFELPELPLRQSLIEAFIERCYTFMPVIELEHFQGESTSGEHSLLVLQAVILAGSLMRPQVCEAGFSERQYQRVKALIQCGHETNPLMMLAALCIVQWYAPNAPSTISADMPKAWNIQAVGLAHQLGLHREPKAEGTQQGLRNRIWWTLVWRDDLMAACHGRPRILQPDDCSAAPPSLQDFSDPADPRASVFCFYVSILGILGDLCTRIQRKGTIAPEDRYIVTMRLHDYLASLPESLRLYSPSGIHRKYDYDLAQLHVPILISVVILFRPRTVYQLSGPNAASVTAAFLLYRIFEAIQLRDETKYLASGFGWYFLVATMPLLSSLRVPALCDEANQALNALEMALSTLAQFKAAPANNLKNIRAIRKGMSVGRAPPSTPDSLEEEGASIQLGLQILSVYGISSVRQMEEIANVLSAHRASQVRRA